MQEPAVPDSPLVVPVIAYEGSADGQPIEEALLSLKNLYRAHSEDQSERRASERFYYKSRPVIILPVVHDPSGDNPPVQIAYAAWTRNLSSSGISIVMASSLMPMSGIDDSVFCVDLKKVSLEGSNALVGLFGSHSEVKWIESEIARARSLSPLESNALELGLRFKEHPTDEWPDADQLGALVAKLRGDLDW